MIKNWWFRKTPEERAELVRRARARGKKPFIAGCYVEKCKDGWAVTWKKKGYH